MLETVPADADWWSLSTRLRNCLRNDNIALDVDVIARFNEEYLLKLPNFGKLSLAELKAFLARFGRQLAELPTPRRVRVNTNGSVVSGQLLEDLIDAAYAHALDETAAASFEKKLRAAYAVLLRSDALYLATQERMARRKSEAEARAQAIKDEPPRFHQYHAVARMKLDGLTTKEIAAKLGRSRGRAYQLVHGLTGYHLRRELSQELTDAGWTDADILAALELTAGQLDNIRNPPPPPEAPDEDPDEDPALRPYSTWDTFSYSAGSVAAHLVGKRVGAPLYGSSPVRDDELAALADATVEEILSLRGATILDANEISAFLALRGLSLKTHSADQPPSPPSHPDAA